MGRGGNEKPGPNLSRFPALLLFLSLPVISHSPFY